jgi:hypothetical protein
MNFRTELHPTPAAYKLNLASKVVTVGSCFSDVIGHQLEKYKLETLTNPFGTIFNPLSACKLLQVCAGADVELADSFVQNNGRWYSYDFHSSFSAETEEELYEMLDEAIVKTRRFLKKADVLVLTLGTANIFRLNITGETVANCHKLPASDFTRETLLPEEIITAVAETHSLLRELNPNLKLVLTVSPVRHLKDTLELNSVSKSVLRLATHFLSQNLPEITYFPAYELLVDDLRDYRFYKEDMLHPTLMAENYIWEKFTGAYFENEFQTFTREWDTVLRAKEHKPFHPESAPHQQFIQNMLEKLRALQDKVNVTAELAYFESQVILIPEPVEEPDSEEVDEEANEIIPSYFSDELSVADIEELPVAALNQQPVSTLPEEGIARKKKKKPRKKKRKPVAPTEETSLSEVGTSQISEVSGPVELLNEPSAELADILADPKHPLEHYGETLSEAPADQARPITLARSKSAKRRDNRKKKKALGVAESNSIPETRDEVATLLKQEEKSLVSPTFSTEIAPDLPEQTPIAEIKTTSEVITEIPAKRSIKKSGGRSKKNAFPDLFAPDKPENAAADANETSAISENALVIPETALENVEPETALPVKQLPKTKSKSRQPKAAKLFAEEATPVTKAIAVPFVNASDLDEAIVAESTSPEAIAKPKSSKSVNTPKTTKAPAKASKKAAEKESKPASDKVKPIPQKRKSPSKKTETDETKPVKAEAKTPTKTGRKKKAAPEA